jgi:general secretion pathway protein C
MRETGHRSLNLATTAVVGLATLAAITALGVAGAYWTWAWFAPRPEPVTEAPIAAARLDAAYRLFGNVRANRTVAAPSSVTFKLLGLAAASGEEPGYAVLQMSSGRAIAVRRGDDIEPGIRLVEVNADHVVLDRNGMRETLALPRQGVDAAIGVERAQ